MTVKKLDLTGTWRAVYCELNGEMTSSARTSITTITYKDDKFSIDIGGLTEHEGTYAINEDTNPAQITYSYSRSSFYELNQPRVGIVQLAGNTFKDCLGGIGAKPPTSFTTLPGSNLVMTVHQRVRSGAGTENVVLESPGLSRGAIPQVVVW